MKKRHKNGLTDHLEVWDWMCNGYTDPRRIVYLKKQGQSALTVTNYTESKIINKYKNLAKVEIEEGMNNINLKYLEIYEKNKGVGASLMNDICSIADILDKSIILSPTSEMGSNIDRLEDFYSKFGFLRHEDKEMIRPRKKRSNF